MKKTIWPAYLHNSLTKQLMSPAHLCACLLLYSARSVSAAPRSTLKPMTASLSLLLVRVAASTSSTYRQFRKSMKKLKFIQGPAALQ